MIVLPIPQGDKLSLLIVLEDDNWERIKKHDNAELYPKEFLKLYPQKHIGTISIAYASPEEMARICALYAKGESAAVLNILTSGFQFKPESGDHDFGPVKIERTKQ